MYECIRCAACACASLLRGGRTRWADPTTEPFSRATNSSRSGTSRMPRKYVSSASVPGGLTQPKPPPSMIAAEVASHRPCRSSSVNSLTRSTNSSAGGAASGAGAGLAVSAMVSGGPAQEIAEDADADLLALFDMELRARAVAGCHHRHHRSAVVGHRNGFLPIAANQGVAVHKIDVVTRKQSVQ